MYKKNDKIELDIIDMTVDGLGIAKKSSQVFFVKDAIIGDKVEAIITKTNDEKKNLCNRTYVIYAKTTSVIEKSKYRVIPKCDISNECGGCQIMSLNYDKQLEFKTKIVKNNLARIGGFDINLIEEKFEGIIGMDEPYHFRNKVQVPFTIREGKVISGFYAGRTHYIIENKNCVTSFVESSKIINDIKDYLNDNLNNNAISIYDEKSGEGVFREVLIRKSNNTNEISVTFIVNDKSISGCKNVEQFKDNKLKKYLLLSKYVLDKNENIVTVTLNINTEKNNVIFGKENIVLYGKGYIEDSICGLKYKISPNSFYQVNRIMTEKLYNTAIEFASLNSEEKVLDLYCGIGTITLLIAKKTRSAIGIDIVKSAIDNAKENAVLNGISNVKFICEDLSKYSMSDINEEYDLVSVDPPRKGLDKCSIDYILSKKPNKVLYVSCDSATLARDLKILCQDYGSTCYNINRIKCVDMFPHTMHVETVVLMSKV